MERVRSDPTPLYLQLRSAIWHFPSHPIRPTYCIDNTISNLTRIDYYPFRPSSLFLMPRWSRISLRPSQNTRHEPHSLDFQLILERKSFETQDWRGHVRLASSTSVVAARLPKDSVHAIGPSRRRQTATPSSLPCVARQRIASHGARP
jgi:hypothetical protein